MRITSVRGKDFITLDEVHFDLSNQGLCLVQGENRDDSAAKSNGAGKSSLADLVCWILWGTTARGSSGDAVIRNGTDRAYGSLLIEDDSEIWEISRDRRKGRAQIKIVGAGATDLTKGTEKLNQELIERIVGCTEDVFRASVYMGQEHLIDLPRMTDKQLKLAVEEAAGVNVLERAYESARARVAKVTTDLNLAAAAVTVAEAKIELCDKLIVSEDTNAVAWTQRAKELLKEKNDALLHKQDQIIKLDERIDPTLLARLRTEIAGVDLKLNEIAEDRRRETALQTALSKAERDVIARATTLKSMISSVKKLQTNIASIKDEIGKPCSVCGTPMTESHLCEARDNAELELAEIAAQMRAERGLHLAATQTAEQAQKALSDHRSAMPDPSELTRHRLMLTEERDAIEQSIKEVGRLRAEAQSIHDQIVKLEAAPNPHMAQIVKLKGERDAHDKHLKGLREAVTEAEKLLEDHKTVVEVFSPAGVRAHILDTVTPYLNARTADYLGTLSDGTLSAIWSTLAKTTKGELRERFSIDVTHTAGDRGFSEISGGEKRKVRLACAMALQDLVASRATKPISLWIADEIDDALDEAGLERLSSVLQEKSKIAGTVLVISHNALESYIPNVWTVIKQGGKSNLEIN